METNRPFFKYAGILVTFSILWMGLSALLFPSENSMPGVAAAVGFQAPTFQLPNLDDRTISLSDFSGKPVILNLWASWCPPCQAEMPVLEKVYEDYRSTGLEVIGVNMTSQDNSLDAVNFITTNNLSFPILFDRDGSMARSYALRSLPTTYFISPDGTIKQMMIGGPFTEAFLRAQVEDLLAMEK